jgi:hypothetical protein
MRSAAYSDNSSLQSKIVELERKYGRWAVSVATSGCPHGDIECIEREAKRFHEVKLHRR